MYLHNTLKYPVDNFPVSNKLDFNQVRVFKRYQRGILVYEIIREHTIRLLIVQRNIATSISLLALSIRFFIKLPKWTHHTIHVELTTIVHLQDKSGPF